VLVSRYEGLAERNLFSVPVEARRWISETFGKAQFAGKARAVYAD
jgi:hypothetical protein